MSSGKLTKSELRNALLKIKGFRTVDQDINFDYRFSLQEGVLEGTKFLNPFMKPAKLKHKN